MEQNKTEQSMESCEKSKHSLAMALVVFALIQFDAVAALIPNQIAAMTITPVVWGIVAVYILFKTKEEKSFSSRDSLTLFFAVTGGAAMAAGNYLYIGLKPLFVRELFTGYPLYTIRNIVYYPMEVLLMLELLIYAQKAGESLTKKTSFPWGALALFLLWGLPHVAWHGFSDGMVSALRAFIYAVPFYASGKNIKTSYISMLILWFL